jgi:hypothetical protein
LWGFTGVKNVPQAITVHMGDRNTDVKIVTQATVTMGVNHTNVKTASFKKHFSLYLAHQ